MLLLEARQSCAMHVAHGSETVSLEGRSEACPQTSSCNIVSMHSAHGGESLTCVSPGDILYVRNSVCFIQSPVDAGCDDLRTPRRWGSQRPHALLVRVSNTGTLDCGLKY